MLLDRAQEIAPEVLAEVRGAFPILGQKIGDHPLVYLDNSATTQKPDAVIDAVTRYYREDNANIHRGVHALSQRATSAYEDARAVVARFIGAPGPEQIVFTRGTTEAINLVAWSFARPRLKKGDVILLTEMEHHANIVPWQLVAEATGARVVPAPVTDSGEVDLEAFRSLLEHEPVALAAFVYISNSLGTVNPVETMLAAARAAGVPTLVDAAQAVSQRPIDVVALDCDFLAFSGHKLFGPTGIGVLYGKRKHLEAMPPYQGGGDMIANVSFAGTTFKGPPERFEAGTPNIAGVVGLGAAVEWFAEQPRERLWAHEDALVRRATEGLSEIDGVRIVGTAKDKASVVSFLLAEAHPHDIGTFLDAEGIAIRAGHHCCQPLMTRYGIPGTARASFSIYNTMEEADRFVKAVARVARFFS
ncbi:MAG: cysteine desulfurase [Opitutales bacterium]|nr:cysteine desulfurase [Opitutales bacterium]